MYWEGLDGRVGWSYFGVKLTQDDWDRYVAHHLALANSGATRLSLMTIARAPNPPNAHMRRQISELIEEQSHILDRVNANAMVLDSALARGALTAINWISPKPFHEKTFKHFADAAVWLAAVDPMADVAALRQAIEAAVPPEHLQL